MPGSGIGSLIDRPYGKRLGEGDVGGIGRFGRPDQGDAWGTAHGRHPNSALEGFTRRRFCAGLVGQLGFRGGRAGAENLDRETEGGRPGSRGAGLGARRERERGHGWES